VQLKYSLSNDCTNPINYKLTSEYKVNEETITHKKFMEMIKGNAVERLKLVSKPYPLKNILLKYKIDGTTFFLNQIIVNTYFYSSKNDLECSSEYIQAVCTRHYEFN
jgi:hypothetical protein